MSDFHPNQIPQCPCGGAGAQDHLCCSVIAADLLKLQKERDTARELAFEAMEARDIGRATLTLLQPELARLRAVEREVHYLMATCIVPPDTLRRLRAALEVKP